MRYLEPYSLISPSNTPVGGGGNGSFYGRVTNVILKPNADGLKGINSIQFSPLDNVSGPSDNVDTSTFTAYPLSSDLITLPIVGEVVRILDAVPYANLDLLVESKKYYYTKIVNIWNSPKDNLFFDTKKNILTNNLHNLIDINPIINNQGDSIFQGRYGQIIKFHQEQDNGKPRIHLSTGRVFESPITKQINIDINNTYSTVEFITDGLSNLKTIKSFSKSHKRSDKPQTSDTYKGEHILVNTGRIVLNSKNDSTLISAKESVSISAKTLNQEADNEICFEAPKIYLGEGALNKSSVEPILLGNKVEKFLSDILDELIEITETLSSAATAAGEPLPLLNKKGAKTTGVLRSLKTKLNPKGESSLKSKKSFAE